MKTLSLGSALTFVGLGLCPGFGQPAAIAALPPYVVTDLGTIAGPEIQTEPGSVAWSIAADGTIVGLSVDSGLEKNLRGFRRGASGMMEALAPMFDDVHSIAYAVSPTGDAVGVSYSLGALGEHAVRWPLAGGSVLLGDFLPRDVNAGGDVVGNKPVADQPGVAHAVRWSNGSLLDLGTLGGPHSAAMAINDNGWIVGESLPATGVNTRGFLWKSGTMTALPTLGGARSHAKDINNVGVVVGIAWTATQPRAVRWTLNAAGAVVQTTNLGVLAGSASAAYAVNDSGVIVGTSNDRATRWTPAAGSAVTLVDLNTLIAPDSDWQLISANSIDATGRIVGAGKHLGRARAFLLAARSPADFNADGVVDGSDLGLLLAGWGTSDPDLDLDQNGTVDGGDIGLVLAEWS